jgi:hypothetical protein
MMSMLPPRYLPVELRAPESKSDKLQEFLGMAPVGGEPKASQRIVAKWLSRVGPRLAKGADEAFDLFWQVCLCRKSVSLEVKPSEGSEGPEEQSPHFYVVGGQKSKAVIGWLGRGCHMGNCTWRHLIGSLKSSYVM